MTRRTLAAPRTPGAALVALALAATASVGALPATGPAVAAAPLERVVVTGVDAATAVLQAGGQVLDALPLVDGVGALLPRGAQLPAGLQVAADRPLSLQQAASPASGTASTVRATLGLPPTGREGEGVLVAVVDTGVAAGLPALDERVEHVAVRGKAGVDGLGHGTFIAGLVAGAGAVPGVAPGAEVLDVKVAGEDGETGLLDVLRGLQAAAEAGADVVNLSLSSGSPLPPALDPLAVALDRLWRDGVVVVVPSGNDASTVSSPGSAPRLLTAGALAEGGTAARADDEVAAFSGRGRSKPDLVAPGASLLSLMAPDSEAAGKQPKPNTFPAGYGAGSGTSFATAVTAGAAAALLSEDESLTPDQVKELLTSTAYGSSSLRKSGGGAGGLDLAAALAAEAPAAKADKADKGQDLPAGDLTAWTRFVEAMIAGDAATAASSWSALSPQARHWAARHWAGVDQETREWEARHWAARHWSVDGWSEQEWLARHWAARHWAARHWADSDWTARHWADSDWAARHWAARHWAGTDSGHGEWSARHWSARHWSARHWSASSWSAAAWS